MTSVKVIDPVLVARIFELKDDGKTSGEIAAALDLKERAVAQRITRANRGGGRMKANIDRPAPFPPEALEMLERGVLDIQNDAKAARGLVKVLLDSDEFMLDTYTRDLHAALERARAAGAEAERMLQFRENMVHGRYAKAVAAERAAFDPKKGGGAIRPTRTLRDPIDEEE